MAAKKTTPKATKPTKATKQKTAPAKPAKEADGKKLSMLDAAAKVLGETGKGMTCREIVELMASKRYWVSPGGATPWGTLNAAIAREIKLKGADSRFAKPERGKYSRKN